MSLGSLSKLILILILGSLTQAQYNLITGFFAKAPVQSGPWFLFNPSGSPVTRVDPINIWTGSKMIVWGGKNGSAVALNSGGIYDPVTNSWSAVTTTGAPTKRYWHSSVWTGTKMIVWGGQDEVPTTTNTGGIYDPALDTWTATTTSGAPSTREGHVAIWTGSEMIIWGGYNGGSLGTGGRYNLATDTWSAITNTGAPAARDCPSAVWTGNKMIVWGGSDLSSTPVLYDPATNTWSNGTTTNAPTGRTLNTLVWTGSRMLVWGGHNGGTTYYTSGGLYDPEGNTWTTISTTSAPPGKISSGGVWTGDQFFVWGGHDYFATPTNVGGIYNPVGDSWTASSTSSPPTARFMGDINNWIVWSGNYVYIFGGVGYSEVHAYELNPTNLSLTVAKVYPSNGSNWLDYVKNYNGGTSPRNQKDEACAGTETGAVRPCIHGGERLKVQVPRYTSCQNLTATDFLEAFNWYCEEQSGSVTFYSTLKIGKGLSDLIDLSSAPGTWRQNYVTVKKSGTTIGSSSASTWWSNTISSLPATNTTIGSGVISLTGYAAGTILTVQSNQQTSGFNINQDKIAVVTSNTATLTYNSDTNSNCDWTTGETTGASVTALICAGSQKYVWLEGNFSGPTGTGLGITLEYQQMRYSRLNKIRVWQGPQYEGVYFRNSSFNEITDVQIQKAYGDWHVFAVEGSTYNYFDTISVAHTTSGTRQGIHFQFSNNNYAHNLKVSGTKDTSYGGAIYVSGSNTNTMTRILSANSDNKGIATRSYDGNTNFNTFAFITSVNNVGAGLTANEGDSNEFKQVTYHNVLLANTYGLGGYSPSDSLFSQIAVAHSTYTHLIVDQGSALANKYTNNTLVGPSLVTPCYSAGSTVAVISSTCGNAGISDANWTISASVDATNSFVGKITFNDTSNPADSSGSQTYASISDWVTFDNPYRVWGLDGASFPSTGNQGWCGSGTCRIWDYRLKSTDTVFRNRTGTGNSANNAFVAGSTCPSELSGNKTLTDKQGVPNTFLVNAMEILNDDTGDEDGLCESNESCIYTPNFGVYQGEGDYYTAGTCNFQNGTVKNVKVYAYPTNGG